MRACLTSIRQLLPCICIWVWVLCFFLTISHALLYFPRPVDPKPQVGQDRCEQCQKHEQNTSSPFFHCNTVSSLHCRPSHPIPRYPVLSRLHQGLTFYFVMPVMLGFIVQSYMAAKLPDQESNQPPLAPGGAGSGGEGLVRDRTASSLSSAPGIRLPSSPGRSIPRRLGLNREDSPG